MRANNEIYLRGLTGAAMDGSTLYGLGGTPEDPAAQADQAMKNARVLVKEVGGSFDDICTSCVSISATAPIVRQSTKFSANISVIPTPASLASSCLVSRGRRFCLKSTWPSTW